MSKHRSTIAPGLVLAVGFALLAAGGPTLAAQSEIEPSEPAVPAGTTDDPSESISEADVFPPPDFLDDEPELNPVDEDSLEKLAASYSSSASVFRKYAYRPFCTTTGCPGGIDHLAAGFGTRNAGFGTIGFRGAPPGAAPVSAFLYWATIQVGAPLTQTVVFNGNLVTGFLISVQPQPCWAGGTNLVAYRAPVLPFILPGINGDYTVRGLPSNLTNGQNPWNPVSTMPPLSEGTSLVVLYTHASVPRGTWTQIHHPVTPNVFGTLTFTHFLNLPIQVQAIKHTRIGADGQVGGGLANINVGTNELTALAGPVPAPFVQIRGNGSYASGNEDSDWNGTDGEPLNQLWDTHTMNIPGVIAAGPTVTNYRVRYNSPIDCIVPVVHVITAR